MTISPSLERTTRGSPSDSRQVKGGNVISFSPGYCGGRPARAVISAVTGKQARTHNDSVCEISRCWRESETRGHYSATEWNRLTIH
jgi:hypothetical protein